MTRIIRGLQPHGGLKSSLMIALGVIQVLGFFGFLGGYFERIDGSLEWHPFVWNRSTLVSSIAVCVSWAAAFFLLLRSKEDTNTKLGGGVLLSLPMALFVLILLDGSKSVRVKTRSPAFAEARI